MLVRDLVEKEFLKKKLPDFRAGDTLKVHLKIIEGGKERIQIFEGVVIRIRGGGINRTFTLRKISQSVGVERTFYLHSPFITKIDLVKKGVVRRAKLYYLRGRIGKTAKIEKKEEQ